MIAKAGYEAKRDMSIFWREKLKCGQIPEPEHVYVPVEECYDMHAPKNNLREFFGRHRCPACGKPYFFLESAFDCHPEASAYEVWEKFAHSGPVGSASPAEAIQTAVYGSGPFGL